MEVKKAAWLFAANTRLAIIGKLGNSGSGQFISDSHMYWTTQYSTNDILAQCKSIKVGGAKYAFAHSVAALVEELNIP